MGSLPHFFIHGAPQCALRARELRYNTSAKLVTQVQITNGFWLAENTKETPAIQSGKSYFNNKILENAHGFQQTTKGFNFVRKTALEKSHKIFQKPEHSEK